MTVGLTNSSINVLESSCSYKSLSRLQPGLERVQGEEADVDGHACHAAGQQGSSHWSWFAVARHCYKNWKDKYFWNSSIVLGFFSSWSPNTPLSRDVILSAVWKSTRETKGERREQVWVYLPFCQSYSVFMRKYTDWTWSQTELTQIGWTCPLKPIKFDARTFF